MNYIKRKLKTTTGLFTIIMGLSVIVLGVSYATFVITTNKYKASEMLISNLTYGISITGDGNSTINGKTVSVGANKTTTLQVKITSLNDITSNYSLEYKILSGSGKVTYLSSTSYTPRTDFSNVFIEENTRTLYKSTGNETEDIDGDGVGEDVYYFAGNAQNNWVKFGKDQDNADLYWRIIRTNEDGSVRLLYMGPDKATTSAFIKIDGTYMAGGSNTTGMYNNTYNNTMYVGYMYGSTGSLASNRGNTTSAPIKTVTDSWYSKTLNVKTDISKNIYDKYISRTAIYCNDRSGDNYSTSASVNYAAYKRIDSSKTPSYKCGNNTSRSLYSDANVADKFSASTTKGGNGQLQYPIAQITADEIAYAGGVYATYGSTAWYYYNSTGGSAVGSDYWWTMSPHNFGTGNAYVFYVYGSGYLGGLNYDSVTFWQPGIRPVLSLKSCVKVTTGNGSSSTPYEVTIDSTCATAEN